MGPLAHYQGCMADANVYLVVGCECKEDDEPDIQSPTVKCRTGAIASTAIQMNAAFILGIDQAIIRMTQDFGVQLSFFS